MKRSGRYGSAENNSRQRTMRFRKLRIAWSVAVMLIFMMWPGTWGTGHAPPAWLDDERYVLYFSAPAVFLAFAPWMRWHFSLRTLLIATTLVAVVLGLVMWM